MASDATLERLYAEFDSPQEHIAAAVALLDTGAPPAFVAFYRRWQTGNMAEERVQAIADRLHFLVDQEQRKQAIVQQARERGGNIDELQQSLVNCFDQDVLDDLYQSLRPRRRTSAMQMEEKGLQPLVLAIQHRQLGDAGLQGAAQQYVSAENGLSTPEEVLAGALLILSEKLVHDPATRTRCRDELRRGILHAVAVNPGKGGAERYQQFFDFQEPIGRIAAGRMLALRRAEREGILKLELGLPENQHREVLRSMHGQDLAEGTTLRDFYDMVFDHAWQNGLREGCGRDVRRRLKEKADREAVRTYARNLRSQLLSPPLGHKKVLALRSSSKTIWLALLGEDGSVQQHKTLHSDSDEQRQAALAEVAALIEAEKPAAIALPHGKRQVGTEKFLEQLRAAAGQNTLPMLVPVDEAASAIFATSPTGRRAMPGVEVGVRTAISLGRRLQDPLRELLRMEFRTLGLGQTLDDVHQGMLTRELDAVVSACVAAVGVDLNTADADLLALVPGIGAERAKAILEHKKRIGGFQTRAQLAEVPGFDAPIVRHIAGFLTIYGGSEPLDRTEVHPDDYEIARAAAAKKGCTVEELFGKDLRDIDLDALTGPDLDRGRVIGVLQGLRAAGHDVRGELTATGNPGILTIADLRSDLELRGRVANLTEFGAFVDLGIGQDGLIHISQIPGYRLRDPNQMLRVGEVVQVWVAHVDLETRKISLTMHKPRHLQEGRQPTLGERLEQGQQRRERPARRREREPQQPVFSRAARAPETRRGRNRSSPLTPDGKPDAERFGPSESGQPAAARHGGGDRGGRGGGERGGFGGRDRGERGERRGRPGDPRVITVDSEREVVEQKGPKGELTSLAGLRALLRKDPPSSDPAS